MKALERFEAICSAMADPAFYPHPVSHLERRETHISTVFLTGRWVYKLKKPVDFGFLDFTDLEARRRFCRQEVVLNQRLSHGVYDRVVEIRQDSRGRLSLEGPGETVAEVAVRMRQLPDEARLKTLLKQNALEPGAMQALGHTLADFFERSARSDAISRYGDPHVIAYNMEENFQQLDPFVPGVVAREPWEFIRQVSRAFFLNWQNLFERRIASGRIRDGHGDLRAEHIYFFEGIQVIDCIEFNERFRYGDVVADLAFLQMDLEHLGHAQEGREVLSAYVARAQDPELYTLIDFYAAYRAIVKVKVNCFRLTEIDDRREQAALKRSIASYLDLAYRYALRFSRPTLWVFCGLPATGKSALGGELARAFQLPFLQSDRIRKEHEENPLAHEHVVPYAEGIYRPEMRQRVYARMLALAQDELKSGRSVVLDASFSRRKWRAEVRQLAQDLDVNLVVVECRCSEATLRDRLKQREETLSLSDARLDHLAEMIAHFEPIEDELPPETHLEVDTGRPFNDSFSEVLTEGYARRCTQVERLL